MTETVLLLDDNDASREILGDLLRIDGYQVESFAKPEVALARLPDIKPYCYVVDFHLPRMNGIAFARSVIETSKEEADKLFLFVTGDASLDEEADISFLSNARILLKPLKLDSLLAMVRTA